MRIALLLTAIDAALVLFPVTAHAGSGFRRAIDAGVAGARKVAVLVNIDKRKQKMTVSLDGVETYEWPIGWAEGIEGFLVVGTSVQLPFDRRALRH
jgi:hypothetical protein